MGKFYILVEGVNIYANVFDTNQLSVIRGTSYLLKHAIDIITKDFELELEAISTGASSGLFLVKDNNNLNELVDRISNKLNEPENDNSLLTFIIESCEANDLLEAKQQLFSQLHISQMQSITIVPDAMPENDSSFLAQADEWEGKRIASEGCKTSLKDKKVNLSNSVYRRLKLGRKLKQSDFSAKGNTRFQDYRFTHDFEELAKYSASNEKLNNKIAVIYMDGNNFGKKQSNILQVAKNNGDDLIEKQKEFDHYIQTQRSDFLDTLKQDMIENKNGLFNQAISTNDKNEKVIHLETLLWGGDEMLFVVPAWLGFNLIQYFFEKSQTWQFDNEKLTHAAGIVFCNVKAPIKNIRNLAQSLADASKEIKKEKSPNSIAGREQNTWSYMVLESIDYPSNSNIDDFNQKYYKDLKKPAFIPSVNKQAEDLISIKDKLDLIINKSILPRRQLYKLVELINLKSFSTEESKYTWEELKKTKEHKELSKQEKQECRLLQLADTNKDTLTNLLETLSDSLFSLDIEKAEERIWLWIYLYELWGYLCPIDQDLMGDDSHA